MTLQRGLYVLENVSAGTVLDLSGDDNGSIIGFDFHGGVNQQWLVRSQGDGWVIESMRKVENEKRYLNVNGQVKDGAHLIATKDALAWQIIEKDAARHIYQIVYKATTLATELQGGDSVDKTPVTLSTLSNEDKMLWKFYILPSPRRLRSD